MVHTSIHERLKRIYEHTNNSLTIETYVSFTCTRGRNAYIPHTTKYHIEIAFQHTKNKWKIIKRYSEFYQLKQQLLFLFKKLQKEDKIQVVSSPMVALEMALNAPFPRRHLRSDTIEIINERKETFEIFVQLLIRVISCIPLSLSVSGPRTWSRKVSVPSANNLSRESKENASVLSRTPNLLPPFKDLQEYSHRLLQLYHVLRVFLEYPEKQIESENKLKLAVFSIEDIPLESKSDIVQIGTTNQNECCSICLGEWEEEEFATMNVVKIPCGHIFHEDCLFEWLHGNVQCPMCRKEPDWNVTPFTL